MGQALSSRTLSSPAVVLPHGKATVNSKPTAPQRKTLTNNQDDNAPQLVAHLGSTKRRSSFAADVQAAGADRALLLHSAIAELTNDMEKLRTSNPADFNVILSSLLEERHAPMLLLDAAELKGRTRLPCYDEVEAQLIPYSEVGPDDTVVFVSHRWWNPGVPDGIHGEKVDIVSDIIQKKVAPKGTGGRVLMWWDFFSIAQKVAEIHTAVKGAQILAIPFYLAAADTLIALRGGDETSYAADVLQSADGGLSHPGRYDNRVWTMLELFGFTSEFAVLCHNRRFASSGRARRVVDCTLGFEGERLVASAIDANPGKMEAVRASLHDTPGWTLPPGDNLTDKNDLLFIQPMVITLAAEAGAETTPPVPALPQPPPSNRRKWSLMRAGAGLVKTRRTPTEPLISTCAAPAGASLARLLRTAASFGFEHAVSSFVELLKDNQQLDANIDAEDDAGHTALSRAVFANQPQIVRHLLSAGADLCKVHRKLKKPPLHLAISLRRLECAAILLDAYDAKGLSLPVDEMGRTCLHLAASTSEPSAGAATDSATVADEPKVKQMARLVQMGVDPTARDVTNRTALDLLHASNAHAVLAEVEKHMSEAEVARCLPRTTVQHKLELPPVPCVAKRSFGHFTPPSNSYGATYRFAQFEPAAHGSGPAGPKIFLMPFAHDEASYELMELLVGQFNATCWLMHAFNPHLAPEHRSPKGVWSSQSWTNHMEQFIDVHCGGRVDCAFGFCKPGESLARIAVSSPAKIGSLVLTSTPASPDTEGEMKEMIEGLRMMIDHMSPVELGMCMLQSEAPCFCAPERKALAEKHAQILYDSWFNNAKEMRTFAPGGLWEDFSSNTRYWRHWNKVSQDILLVAGTDDSSFLVGMENLAALVPRSQLEWVAGVGHVPFIEAPEWYRARVLGFVEAQGFARLVVEEM